MCQSAIVKNHFNYSVLNLFLALRYFNLIWATKSTCFFPKLKVFKAIALAQISWSKWPHKDQIHPPKKLEMHLCEIVQCYCVSPNRLIKPHANFNKRWSCTCEFLYRVRPRGWGHSQNKAPRMRRRSSASHFGNVPHPWTFTHYKA